MKALRLKKRNGIRGAVDPPARSRRLVDGIFESRNRCGHSGLPADVIDYALRTVACVDRDNIRRRVRGSIAILVLQIEKPSLLKLLYERLDLIWVDFRAMGTRHENA